MRPFPTVTPLQAKRLAGESWTVDGVEYRFGTKVHSGKEAVLYPLLDDSGEVVAYLRLLNAPAVSPERIHRTEWLVASRLDLKSPAFEAAPRAWATTLHSGRVPGVDRDFAGTLHTAVPGQSWRRVKLAADERTQPLPTVETRQRLVRDLLFQLADLEEVGFVHGDLSDGNLVVDLSQGTCRLVDFGAFVHEGDPRLRCPSLPLSMGGVKGTPGYLPPDLDLNESLDAAPYSDRHARDMLLVELLAFTPGDPVEASPRNWGKWETVRELLRPVASSLSLEHLLQANLFEMPESERPTSRSLAMRLGWKPFAERPAPPLTFAEQVEELVLGPWGAAAAAGVVGLCALAFAWLLFQGSMFTWAALAAMAAGTFAMVQGDAKSLWQEWERSGYSLRWVVELIRPNEGR